MGAMLSAASVQLNRRVGAPVLLLAQRRRRARAWVCAATLTTLGTCALLQRRQRARASCAQSCLARALRHGEIRARPHRPAVESTCRGVCAISRTAPPTSARVCVRQRSRRSGRARCCSDVNEHAHQARSRVSRVLFGTARSEPGFLSRAISGLPKSQRRPSCLVTV